METATADKPLAFVGTYTSGDSEGIYVCRMDPQTGALECVGTAGPVQNPSFLALHPSRPFLYAVQEVGEGKVNAYAYDPPSGSLTYLNEKPSGGSVPCHLSVDQTGRYVAVANYGSGSAALLPIDDDGGLASPSDVVQHEGSSADPRRQEGPHAHSATIDPTNSYVFVADLGIDKVMAYRLDLENGKLPPNEVPFAEVASGSGPRHLAFHPSGRHAYVINEMGNTVVAYEYDAGRGALHEMQTLPSLPDGFADTSHTADIHVEPSGRFVYGSNRGHDSIVIYAVEEAAGRLTLIGHQPTGGKTPRNFAIAPDGGFLLAANQESGTIVTLRINASSGELTATGHVTEVPSPVCIAFAPAELGAPQGR